MVKRVANANVKLDNIPIKVKKVLNEIFKKNNSIVSVN
jgi:hypothetical protein